MVYLAYGILYYALEVEPCDFLHILLAHAHSLEAGEEIRYLGAVFKPIGAGAARIGHRAHGIRVINELEEVEAAADVVDAHDVDHVRRVLGKALDGLVLWVVIYEDVERIQAHNAVYIAYGAKLIVRKVAEHAAHRTAVGMGCDEGLLL